MLVGYSHVSVVYPSRSGPNGLPITSTSYASKVHISNTSGAAASEFLGAALNPETLVLVLGEVDLEAEGDESVIDNAEGGTFVTTGPVEN